MIMMEYVPRFRITLPQSSPKENQWWITVLFHMRLLIYAVSDFQVHLAMDLSKQIDGYG